MSDSRDLDNPDGRDVMSNLPTTRPQRRSSKRGAAGGAKSAKAAQRSAPITQSARSRGQARPGPQKRAKPAGQAGAREGRKPAAVRPSAATRRVEQSGALGGETGRPRVAPGRTPPAPGRGALVSTTLQAAGELAQLGVTLGARVLRGVASRVPRP